MFPLYIWLVTGLLLLALTFFVFAQAAVVRSGAQSAADAAALAAAQEARDRMFGDFLEAAREEDSDPEDIEGPVGGDDVGDSGPCAAAARLAASNDATVTSCESGEGGTAYTVVVESTETVGDSVIPGTENQTATARATAVIGVLCDEVEEGDDGLELRCEERDWVLDPDDEDGMPEARDLFEVYLED